MDRNEEDEDGFEMSREDQQEFADQLARGLQKLQNTQNLKNNSYQFMSQYQAESEQPLDQTRKVQMQHNVQNHGGAFNPKRSMRGDELKTTLVHPASPAKKSQNTSLTKLGNRGSSGHKMFSLRMNNSSSLEK